MRTLEILEKIDGTKLDTVVEYFHVELENKGVITTTRELHGITVHTNQGPIVLSGKSFLDLYYNISRQHGKVIGHKTKDRK